LDVWINRIRPKRPPTCHISLRVDLLRLLIRQVGIVSVRPVRIGMAVVTARRVDQIASEADQLPIFASQIEMHGIA